jgi:hypothetical protein
MLLVCLELSLSAHFVASRCALLMKCPAGLPIIHLQSRKKALTIANFVAYSAAHGFWSDTSSRYRSTGGTRMNEAEEAARPRVRAAVEGLEEVQTQLQEVAAGLPAPDEEVSLRSVIECVLVDSLQPAIRDLRAALA